jgi:hypothetical protein
MLSIENDTKTKRTEAKRMYLVKADYKKNSILKRKVWETIESVGGEMERKRERERERERKKANVKKYERMRMKNKKAKSQFDG